MCGIVGYVGRSEAAPILLDGLRRLEYRGYDSAGVAIVNGETIETRKCAGRIANLAKLMTERPPAGQYGISHTRWATHGKVTDENAHPHFDHSGKIALVHNGVIENYAALREQLRSGVAIVNGETIETRKCAGRIANLAKLMTERPPAGQYGISHTRWATHGKVTDENAHPHFDHSGKIALVHNGVIENYAALREQL